MNPRRSRDSRFVLLLEAVKHLDGPDEVRSFLDTVCEDDPALMSALDETITFQPKDAAPSEPAPVQVGQMIADRFQLLRPIGEGGMGVVFEAMDTKVMERRALKFSKARHANSIPPEARSAMRVTHNNICRIHEIHTTETGDGPLDFISMEFVEGETLSSRCQRSPVPHAEAVDIALQLCLAIDAAHKANVLHRDLKSNNVMLSRNADGTVRAVVMDFGLAKPMGSDRTASTIPCGTPNYIAPECWKGEPASAASDIYALGVILYELLTGRLPFLPRTPWAVRLNQLPDLPGKCERAPDPGWDAIVLQCLQPDPSRRFSSASAVLEAIEKKFRTSYARRWVTAALIAIAAVTPIVVFRDRIWPPPIARLAVLPVNASTGDRSLDDAIRGSLFEIAGRLQSAGAAAKKVFVIPFEETLRNEILSPAVAAAKLGATHALTATVIRTAKALAVRAAVVDARTGERIREFSGDLRPDDVAELSTLLAGVVTSAFRLEAAPVARIAPAAYPHYAAGLAALRRSSSNFESAIASFEEALKIDSRSPSIYGGLGEGYLNKFIAMNDSRWLREAWMHAQRARSLNPDSPEVLLLLGRVEQASGRPEQAIELFHRAAEQQPNNSEVWRRTGLALQALGRYADAANTLKKAVDLDPGYYNSHLSLGLVFWDMGRTSEAVEEFRTVSQLAPQLPEAFANLGAALLAIDKEQEAEQALRRSIALRETRRALNNLGVLLRYQGRDREAVEALQRALKAGADDARLRLNIGNALLKIGRRSEARENFERASSLAREALLLDPRNAAARAQRAYSMVRLGPPGLAGDEALQAARLATSQYAVTFWAVMTLEALGRRNEALALLENTPFEQLKDLRRQPDLADFSRDPKFIALLQSRSQSTTERRTQNGRIN